MADIVIEGSNQYFEAFEIWIINSADYQKLRFSSAQREK